MTGRTPDGYQSVVLTFTSGAEHHLLFAEEELSRLIESWRSTFGGVRPTAPDRYDVRTSIRGTPIRLLLNVAAIESIQLLPSTEERTFVFGDLTVERGITVVADGKEHLLKAN